MLQVIGGASHRAALASLAAVKLAADWLVSGEPLEDALPVPFGTQIGS